MYVHLTKEKKMSWIDNVFGDDLPVEDVSALLREYVKRGMVEQSIDENGDFVFSLTELGEQIFKDLTYGFDNKEDSE
tara:strand:- start:1083 stop:1313 length:231 start_codon:yes stop_codon:yes gene_type:complete